MSYSYKTKSIAPLLIAYGCLPFCGSCDLLDLEPQKPGSADLSSQPTHTKQVKYASVTAPQNLSKINSIQEAYDYASEQVNLLASACSGDISEAEFINRLASAAKAASKAWEIVKMRSGHEIYRRKDALYHIIGQAHTFLMKIQSIDTVLRLKIDPQGSYSMQFDIIPEHTQSVIDAIAQLRTPDCASVYNGIVDKLNNGHTNIGVNAMVYGAEAVSSAYFYVAHLYDAYKAALKGSRDELGKAIKYIVKRKNNVKHDADLVTAHVKSIMQETNVREQFKELCNKVENYFVKIESIRNNAPNVDDVVSCQHYLASATNYVNQLRYLIPERSDEITDDLTQTIRDGYMNADERLNNLKHWVSNYLSPWSKDLLTRQCITLEDFHRREIIFIRSAKDASAYAWRKSEQVRGVQTFIQILPEYTLMFNIAAKAADTAAGWMHAHTIQLEDFYDIICQVKRLVEQAGAVNQVFKDKVAPDQLHSMHLNTIGDKIAEVSDCFNGVLIGDIENTCQATQDAYKVVASVYRAYAAVLAGDSGALEKEVSNVATYTKSVAEYTQKAKYSIEQVMKNGAQR